MTELYVLDVPENATLPEIAGEDGSVTVGKVGPYFQIASDGPIVIDRRATGCRHAVWYSAIAGVRKGRIVQHDKDALRLEPA